MSNQASFIMLCPAVQQDQRICRRKTVNDASPFCGIHCGRAVSEGDFKKAIELGHQEAFEREKRRQERVREIKENLGDTKPFSGSDLKMLVPAQGISYLGTGVDGGTFPRLLRNKEVIAAGAFGTEHLLFLPLDSSAALPMQMSGIASPSGRHFVSPQSSLTSASVGVSLPPHPLIRSDTFMMATDASQEVKRLSREMEDMKKFVAREGSQLLQRMDDLERKIDSFPTFCMGLREEKPKCFQIMEGGLRVKPRLPVKFFFLPDSLEDAISGWREKRLKKLQKNRNKIQKLRKKEKKKKGKGKKNETGEKKE